MGLLKQKHGVGAMSSYDGDDMQKLDKPEKTETFEKSSRSPLGMNLTKDKDARMTTPPPSTPTSEEKKKSQSPAATTDIAQKESNQTVVSSLIISTSHRIHRKSLICLQSFSCDSNYVSGFFAACQMFLGKYVEKVVKINYFCNIIFGLPT
ncbi:uncharacterized protein ACN2A1_001222 isoform 1-T2 [Glossina fuscipes fuscipes]